LFNKSITKQGTVNPEMTNQTAEMVHSKAKHPWLDCQPPSNWAHGVSPIAVPRCSYGQRAGTASATRLPPLLPRRLALLSLSICAGLPPSSMIHLSIPHTYGLSGLLATAAPRHLTTIDPPSSAALVPPVTMVSSQRLKVAEAKFDKNITRKTSTNAKDKVRRRLVAPFWGWSRLEAEVHCGTAWTVPALTAYAYAFVGACAGLAALWVCSAGAPLG